MDVFREAIELGINIIERWSPASMLRSEIDSPEQDLMKSTFYARRSVCIRAICIGKFLSYFSKFEISNAQELNDTTCSRSTELVLFDYLSRCRGWPALTLGELIAMSVTVAE
jgi:hypothetical protein